MPETMTQFENDVMKKLLAGNDPNLETLRQQFALSTFDRDMTGAGFYLNFKVPEGRTKVTPDCCKFGDVFADIEGLQFGAGFLLYVEAGKLKSLEGYSFEEPWPANVVEYSLTYTNETRSLPF